MGEFVDLGEGTFNRRVLLLGAGFSRNWGGRLAREIWEDVFGHPKVRERAALRPLLMAETSFEAILEKVRHAPFGQEDLKAVETALADTFERMDRTFREPRHPVSTYTLNRFLNLFCPGPVGQGTGYVFSLNQDLLVERKHGTQPECQRLSLPGVRWHTPPHQWPAADWDIPLAALVDPHVEPPKLGGNFNLIKPHGSINWRSADGSATMIIGTRKEASIAAIPLLTWYFEVFKSVLRLGNVRLMTIGYGWADDHINAVIADAVKNHGLGVYHWSTADPRAILKSAAHGDVILDGLIGAASRPMAEVMPEPQNPITTEYERIVNEFF